jgi:hypothetical protein
MNARLGHDFSQVRVHTDDHAAESTNAVDALAYTVGSHIAFGPGQYAPNESTGRRLLAHELTHVVQQTAGVPGSGNHTASAESDASNAGALAESVNAASAASLVSRSPVQSGVLQRQPAKKALDARASAIVAGAQDDTKKTREERAVDAVRAIVNQYYASDASLVSDVVYDDAKAGSGVHVDQKFGPDSKPATSTGVVYVGATFLAGVDQRNFARRVLQIGHEIEHITQWRGGLAGGQNKAEREFLAFYHEALGVEKAGTGTVPHATRVALIDAALGNFFCLTAEKQKANESKKSELIKRRSAEVASSNRKDLGEAPSACRQSS